MLQEQYRATQGTDHPFDFQRRLFEGIRERLPMLNLHLDTSSFCRIRCVLESTGGNNGMEGIACRDVEELSDEGVWLYPFWEKMRL